jgi:iron complex outermembrane receptor protein
MSQTVHVFPDVARRGFTVGALETARTMGLACALLLAATRLGAQQPDGHVGPPDHHDLEALRRVSGEVTDSATGRPVADARLEAAPGGETTTTDPAGRFELRNLRPGIVTLAIHAIGYQPWAHRIDLSDGDVELRIRLAASALQLDSIVVRADSAVERFLEAPRATATMDAAQVAAERGQTLGETIRELPGVAVIQFGPSIAKPVIRGLHSHRIAVINGAVPQEGQQWGAEHAPEIDAFAANEIEVIRGPAAVTYGSDALGGVLRVSPRPLPSLGRFGGELSTNGFSNNRQGAASLLMEGSRLPLPVTGPLAWRVQLSGRKAGDAETPDYYLRNTGFQELNYGAAVGLRRGWGESELSYTHFGSDLGLYLGAHVGNVDDLERAMANPLVSHDFSYDILRPKQEVRHDLVSWRTKLAMAQAGRLEVTYGYQLNERSEFDGRGFLAGGNRPAFGLKLYTHSLAASFHHAPVGPLVGTVGVSGMRQGNLSPGRSFLIPQYRLYTGGVHALEQLKLGRFSVIGGLRYDYRWQHAYQYGAPVVISPDDVRSYDNVSGSLGGTYRLTDGWSLAANIGRAWRAPNVNELFSRGVHHGTAQYEIGDASLDTERAVNLDATLRHVGSRVVLEVTGYRNRIDGYIHLRPRAPVQTVRGAYPAYAYAQTDAELWGVEATSQVTPTRWLTLYASGTVVRGTDRVADEPLFDMPADRLIASARLYGPSRSWVAEPYLELGTTLVRRQNRVPSATVYRLPTDGYALIDVAIGAGTWRVAGQALEASLAVRNLFDVHYRDYLSRYRLFVDEPGRNVILRVALPFGDTRGSSSTPTEE